MQLYGEDTVYEILNKVLLVKNVDKKTSKVID